VQPHVMTCLPAFDPFGYCCSNISESALYIGSFRPGREICDLIGIADFGLRVRSRRHMLRPFHNRINGLISIAEAGGPSEDSGTS